MSLTVYYCARRKRPLTTAERKVVSANVRRWARKGLNYDFEAQPDGDSRKRGQTVLQGATDLPWSTNEATTRALYRVTDALAELRWSLSGLRWSVQFEDIELKWDAKNKRYKL